MSKCGKLSGQSDASKRLGQNSTVGQTVANQKKAEEAARKAELNAQAEAEAREQGTAINYQQHAKQKEAQSRNRVVENSHITHLIQQGPPKSKEQLERERRIQERRAALDAALR